MKNLELYLILLITIFISKHQRPVQNVEVFQAPLHNVVTSQPLLETFFREDFLAVKVTCKDRIL